MKNTYLLFVLLAAVLLLQSCGSSVNTKLSIDVSGPCEECPQSRLDSVLKSIDGIANFEFSNGQLTIELDSTVVSRDQLASALNKAGYDYDVKLGLLPQGVSCCKDPMGIDGKDDDDDEADLLDDTDDALADDGLDDELEGGLFDEEGDIGTLDEEMDDNLLQDEEDVFNEKPKSKKTGGNGGKKTPPKKGNG